MEYVKINSLWKRQEYVKGLTKGSHGPLIVGEYSLPEFGIVKYWNVEEKVDGTNIRIIYEDGKLKFAGRTKDAQLPPHLLEYLQNTLKEEDFLRIFPRVNNEINPHPFVILFGEGYGPKIQAGGGNYRSDPGFILFDVFFNGWWFKRDAVLDIANEIKIPKCPEIGIMTEEEIIQFIKSKPLSRCSQVPQMMEGIIARSDPLLLFRNGQPLMWKLKCKEFI